MRRYGWLLAIAGLGVWWASSFTAADANPAPPEPTVGSLPVTLEGDTAIVGAPWAENKSEI